jgi:hypothetical protein
MGSNIVLNLFYLLMFIILPTATASEAGMYFLITLAFISFIIYLAISYKCSNLIFIIRLKSLASYEEVYQKYTTAQCVLNFSYAPTRNNIDEEIKKY